MVTDTHLHHHHETHMESSDLLRDIVIGMSDGLTVPFALAAGLSGAVDSNRFLELGADVQNLVVNQVSDDQKRFVLLYPDFPSRLSTHQRK